MNNNYTAQVLNVSNINILKYSRKFKIYGKPLVNIEQVYGESFMPCKCWVEIISTQSVKQKLVAINRDYALSDLYMFIPVLCPKSLNALQSRIDIILLKITKVGLDVSPFRKSSLLINIQLDSGK